MGGDGLLLALLAAYGTYLLHTAVTFGWTGVTEGCGREDSNLPGLSATGT